MASPSSAAPSSSVVLTAKNVQALLGSGLIDECTPTIAKKLVDRFGPKACEEILSSDPTAQMLCGTRWAAIQKDLEDKEKDLPLLAWLAVHEATPWMATKAVEWAKSPENAQSSVANGQPALGSLGYLTALLKDPHLLGDVPGIGFVRADAIALKSGVEPTSTQRLKACARFAVSQACDDAGGGARLPDIQRVLARLIGSNNAVSSMESTQLATPALDLARKHDLAKDAVDEEGRPMIFSAEFHRAEEDCARELLKMSEQDSPYKNDNLERSLDAAQKDTKITLTPQQREAIQCLLQGRVAIISGKPGAGKTTLLQSVALFLEGQGRSVVYAAPTGKAAKRMAQSIKRPATTIHRMLGMGKPKGKTNGQAGAKDLEIDSPLKLADAVVLDEASMLDVQLLSTILRNMGPKTLLLLVGDPGQLPSIRAGKALSDLMDSGVFPCARLTQIMRQGANSDIPLVARGIDEGNVPDFRLTPNAPPERRTSDCLFLEESSPELLGQRIVALLRSAQAKGNYDPLRDAQVITASNIGASGSFALNALIQNAFNPKTLGKAELEVRRSVKGKDETFFLREGDKVMQTINESEKPLTRLPDDKSGAEPQKGIFNGDVGYIESITKLSVTVRFDNGIAAFKIDEARKSLTLSYANTVHKFQGSESPLLFFALHSSTPRPLLTRNLVYTAITRAKTKCVVLGSFSTLRDASRVDALARRKTRLRGLLDGSITPENAPPEVLAIFERRAMRRVIGLPVSLSTAPIAHSTQPASVAPELHEQESLQQELALSGEVPNAELTPKRVARRL